MAPGNKFVMVETAKNPQDTAIKFLMEDINYKTQFDFTGLTDNERL